MTTQTEPQPSYESDVEGIEDEHTHSADEDYDPDVDTNNPVLQLAADAQSETVTEVATKLNIACLAVEHNWGRECTNDVLTLLR